MKHVGPISGVAAHDGKLVATAGYDNQVILWSLHDKTPISRAYHDHLANQCSFSPDGRLLATASSDYSARIWSVPNLRLKSLLDGHADDVEMVVFSPDGRNVATCSRDCTLCLFDTDGTLLNRMSGHTADVISVAWSADGQSVMSSSDDGTVRRWDAVSGKQLDVYNLNGVETDTLVIASDGRIFAGDDEGRISILHRGMIEQVKAHDAGIKRLLYDERHQRIASLSYDRTFAVWALTRDGSLRPLLKAEFPSIVWPRAGSFVSRDQLVFGTFGSSFAVYDIEGASWNLDAIEPDKSINAIAFDRRGRLYSVGDAGIVHCDGEPARNLGSLCNFLMPFGKAMLSGGQMGCVFDASTAEVLHQHRSPLNCAALFEQDGDLRAIIGSYTGEGLIFKLDPAKRPVFVESVQLHTNAIKGLAANAETVFSVSATGAAAAHRTADLASVWSHDDAHDRIANGCAALGADRFASVSRDLKLRIWTGDRAQTIETPHRNSIKCIATCPAGRWVATGGYTGTVAVYDVQTSSWCSVTRPTAWGISCLVALPGTDGFLASAYDGSTHVVHAARAAAA